MTAALNSYYVDIGAYAIAMHSAYRLLTLKTDDPGRNLLKKDSNSVDSDVLQMLERACGGPFPFSFLAIDPGRVPDVLFASEMRRLVSRCAHALR